METISAQSSYTDNLVNLQRQPPLRMLQAPRSSLAHQGLISRPVARIAWLQKPVSSTYVGESREGLTGIYNF